MRGLVVFDSTNADSTFEGIVKKWIECGNEIGLYDVANKKEYFGVEVHSISELSEVIVEYYEIAICMYEALGFIRNYDIYVFSYLLNNFENNVANPGADFLFISQGSCCYECAYAEVGPVNEENELEIYQQIVSAIMSLNFKMLRNMEYPSFRKYSILELEDQVNVEEDMTLKSLKRFRLMNYLCSLRRIEVWTNEQITNEYIKVIKNLALDSRTKDSSIKKNEKLIAYTLFSENKEQILKEVSNNSIAVEYICDMLLHNTLYSEAKEVVERTKCSKALSYYVLGVNAYYNEEYEQSISLFNQCLVYMTSKEEKCFFANKSHILGAVEKKYLALLRTSDKEINSEELVHYLKKACLKEVGVFYFTLLKETASLIKQGKMECAKNGEKLYHILQTEVAKDAEIYKQKYLCDRNKYLYNKNRAGFAGNKVKQRAYKVVALFYRCIARFRRIAASNKVKLLVKKFKAFDRRTKKFIKRKFKAMAMPLHLYGKNERRLLKFRNKYQGKRCFILGNGPSLRIADLDKLHENGDICFACNKIYKVFEHTVWRPTFYACIDSAVFRQNYYSILNRGDYQKFLGANLPLQDEIRKNKQNILVNYATKDIRKTKFNPRGTFIYSGGTVTFVLITLAWMLGFREIYLIGCDHSYGFFGSSNSGAVSSTSETNNDYFMKNYMRPGEVINVGNLDRSHEGYSIARRYIESHGGRIYNATRGGKLEVFERRDLDEVLNEVNR